jgi:hypothetical protein
MEELESRSTVHQGAVIKSVSRMMNGQVTTEESTELARALHAIPGVEGKELTEAQEREPGLYFRVLGARPLQDALADAEAKRQSKCKLTDAIIAAGSDTSTVAALIEALKAV